MRPLIIALLASSLTACAATYTAPTTSAPHVSATVHASQAALIRAAKITLASEGFQILSSDASAGTVSTVMRPMHITPAEADCGTTMGLNYLKDQRTETRVGYNVIAANGSITVVANIEGEYRPGGVDQNITLTCVSSGALERAMLRKIVAAAQ